MTRIFVYGTLKRGGSNHGQLAGQQFIGAARTPPGFTLYSLGSYPGMVRAADDRAGVIGEVWAVDAACRQRLDELEGVEQGLYERVPLTLPAPFHEEPVETYLYLRSTEACPHLGPVWRE